MKKLELSVDEAVNYLKENVKIHDNLEIAYNRIFAEGEVLNVDFSKYFGNIKIFKWELYYTIFNRTMGD